MFAIGLSIFVLCFVLLLFCVVEPHEPITHILSTVLVLAIIGSVSLMVVGAKEEGLEQGRLEILKQQPYYVELLEELERVDKHRAGLLKMRNQMEKMAK